MKEPQIRSDLRPLLLELLQSGMTQADIARQLMLSRATVNFAVKKEGPWMPGYDTGARLVALHGRVVSSVSPAGLPNA